MIKTIQLLKESIATYKANFKNIALLIMPFTIIGLIGGIIQSFTEQHNEDTSYYLDLFMKLNDSIGLAGSISLLILFTISGVFLSIYAYLYILPAVLKALQKNEDTGVFDKVDSLLFAKKNIWNYVVLGFWSVVYSIYVNLKYIVMILVVLSAALIAAINTTSEVFEMGIVFVAILATALIIIISIVKNLAKFVLTQNVFFSTDLSPRDSVRQSMKIGDEKKYDVWRILWTNILFSLIVGSVMFILGIIVGFTTDFNLPVRVSVSIVDVLAQSLFILPVSFIILAKGYNKIMKTESEVDPVL